MSSSLQTFRSLVNAIHERYSEQSNFTPQKESFTSVSSPPSPRSQFRGDAAHNIKFYIPMGSSPKKTRK